MIHKIEPSPSLGGLAVTATKNGDKQIRCGECGKRKFEIILPDKKNNLTCRLELVCEDCGARYLIPDGADVAKEEIPK